MRLPYQRLPIDKRDFKHYEALFADYLDIQKGLDIDALSADEVKGRFKSFLGKWNRGELAQGWYDPEMQQRVEARFRSRPPPSARSVEDSSVQKSSEGQYHAQEANDGNVSDEEDDDDYGPVLPDSGRAAGAAIPSLQDLQHRRELAEEDWENRREDARFERKAERKLQKERLEELVPRAEPGSRERQLEKKREVTAGNRAFADAKTSGMEEVNDKDLMGDDGGDSFKAQMKVREKKKNEREIRKEEILRARAAEREERLAVHKQKEEKTMEMLKSIAKQRFG